MNKIPTLYKTPFIVATVFIVLAVALFLFGGFIDFGDASFAMIAFGVLLLIFGIVTLSVYAMMEKRFKQAIGDRNGILLQYQMNENEFISGVSKQSDNIKNTNKSSLLIMLSFCVIIAIGGPLLVEDGYIFSIIAIGLGVFLSLMALIITKYRTKKIKKGNREVLLTVKAAYVFGELHSWQLPGFLLNVEYSPAAQDKKYNSDVIEIKYTAVAMPIQVYEVSVPVPRGLENQAQQAVSVLHSIIMSR